MRIREKQVRVRMTDREYAAYQKRLTQSKLSGNSFGIKCLLCQPINIVEVVGLTALQRQLGAIGNNLNQITKVLNSGGLPQLPMIEDLEKGVAELWQLLKSVKVVKH